jgi:hypothetical protein
MLAARGPYYENADIAIQTDGKSPLEIAEEIIETLKVEGGK